VVVGVRLDDHETAGSKVTPRVGLNYALSSRTRLRASYSEGFRAPNFVELYYPPIFGPGYSGNPDLKPEKSRQYEIGLSAQIGKGSFDLAVFSTVVRDMIYSDGATPYQNVGRAEQRGIEISWDRKLSASVSLGLAYTYIDARNQSTDERLRGIPHNELSMTLAGVVQSWQVGITGRWTDDRPDLVFNPMTWVSSSVMTQGRAIFDLTVSRRGTALVNPFVAVRNLFDVEHEEVAGYPAEGRSIEVGVQSTW
jgi:outer membrane cobalamin receptor